MSLQGKKIILGLTGSIAVYKSAIFVRLLVKAGAEVKVIMTREACSFVAPLTFSTLSKNRVLTELTSEGNWESHVILGRWADVMVIAPASANTIAKMANGLCDNLLLAVFLSATCPVVLAPAMDEDMWHHLSTQKNMEILRKNGQIIIPVNKGELASGLNGEGRMAEPEELIEYLNDFFSENSELKGKKALVTAGPTYEPLDPVRFIGNHSSGKMGVALAEALRKKGADVRVILGPSNLKPDSEIMVEKVTTAKEMYDAVMKDFDSFDIIIMAAAVADYAPKTINKQKIKKHDREFSLELVKTKDILSEAGKRKSPQQTLVGFALETENEKANAIQKLEQKNADLIVLNSLNDEKSGFGGDTNKITIFTRNKLEHNFPLKSKKEAAFDIVNTIIQYRNE